MRSDAITFGQDSTHDQSSHFEISHVHCFILPRTKFRSGLCLNMMGSNNFRPNEPYFVRQCGQSNHPKITIKEGGKATLGLIWKQWATSPVVDCFVIGMGDKWLEFGTLRNQKTWLKWYFLGLNSRVSTAHVCISPNRQLLTISGRCQSHGTCRPCGHAAENCSRVRGT